MLRDVGLLLLLNLAVCSSCTAYAAGRKATADGFVLVSHSDDGAGASDPRASMVPAADHPAGSRRPIWPDLEDWPRFIGHDRGLTYEPQDGQGETQPIGSIPQVEHTHAYLDGNYAVQNDCDLMFGESTASAPFRTVAVGEPGGVALFSVNELTRVAAERVCSAREAVQLMGDLAETYGFYGADGGAGEVLMVGDAEEAFVFHILSDDTGASAVWVAQRVPDDHVAVAANMFTIREVDLEDSFNFLGSGGMHALALKYGLWDGRGLLSFTDAFSGGEYSNRYYSGRSRIAPPPTLLSRHTLLQRHAATARCHRRCHRRTLPHAATRCCIPAPRLTPCVSARNSAPGASGTATAASRPRSGCQLSTPTSSRTGPTLSACVSIASSP